MARSANLTTPKARMSFPNLTRPQTMERDDGSKIEKYNVVLLFPKSTDLSELKETALAAAKEQWGDKAVKMIKDGLIKTPFLDGDGPQGRSKKTGETHNGYAGMTFIRVASNEEPVLVDGKRKPLIDDKEVYAGRWAYAVVNAFTWEHEKNGRGISFGLNMLQVADHDEPLGAARPNPDDYFPVIDTGAGADKSDSNAKDASGLFG